MTVTALLRQATPDAELVARYVAAGDQPAFAELVRRHGPQVLAACRHVTRHAHDADDAFQATFLVLAKKAHALDPSRPLGAWLRGVAVRAGKKAARRRPTLPLTEVCHRPHTPDGEAVAAVRAAVASLPCHQRLAVERCELAGRPRAEVAGELGIPPGTLSSRLALARRALARRLTRQGFAPAVVPAALATAAASEVPSRRAVELAEAVMRTKWHGWAVAVLAAAVGVGVAAEPAPAPRPRPAVTGIVVGLGDTLRVLDPDGRERAKLTGKQMRAAGADLRETVALGLDVTREGGLKPVVARHDRAEAAGRVRPDGAVPVRTRRGVDLVHLGDAAAVSHLTAGDYVAAWSPDGRRAVVGADDGHAVLDTATGRRTRLPLPARHFVAGWAPAGDWLLTVVSPDTAWGGLAQLFEDSRRYGVYRVALDGTVLGKLAAAGPTTTAALSPDGTRVLTTDTAATGPRLKAPLWGNAVGHALRVIDVATGDATDLVHAPPPADGGPGASVLGAAWSPDGTRVAYSETSVTVRDGKPVGGARLVVIDVATGERRVVHTGDTFGVFDWR